MLNDAINFNRIFIACGFTDLRRGIDGLAATIKNDFRMDPYEQGTIFLFCGRRTDRIKAFVYEGDGFVLAYKRLSSYFLSNIMAFISSKYIIKELVGNACSKENIAY